MNYVRDLTNTGVKYRIIASALDKCAAQRDPQHSGG